MSEFLPVPGGSPGKEKHFFRNCIVLGVSLVIGGSGMCWLLNQISPYIFNTK